MTLSQNSRNREFCFVGGIGFLREGAGVNDEICARKKSAIEMKFAVVANA